jgi:hypothetical protein
MSPASEETFPSWLSSTFKSGNAARACKLTRRHIRESSANASKLLETKVELQADLSKTW